MTQAQTWQRQSEKYALYMTFPIYHTKDKLYNKSYTLLLEFYVKIRCYVDQHCLCSYVFISGLFPSKVVLKQSYNWGYVECLNYGLVPRT